MYSKVKSKFIKNKIKERNWKSKDYIDDLIYLEEYISGEIYGLGGNWKAASMKSEYKKEYDAIFKELKPKDFKQYIKQERREAERERKENEKFEKREQREHREAKKDWIKAGGKT